MDKYTPNFGASFLKKEAELNKMPFPKFDTELPKITFDDSVLKDLSDDLKADFNKQLDKVNSSLTEQIEFAKSEAKSAKKGSLVSNAIAVISVIVSIVAIMFSIF